jgi:aldose 1-epimerase
MRDDLLRLSSDKLELWITPSVGGSIARLDYFGAHGPVSVLRGANDADFEVEAAASFPLVPWCNRIRDGRFNFAGRETRPGRTKPDEAMPLHGHGWMNAWRVLSRSEGKASIGFLHEPGRWPWRYEARQDFELSALLLHYRLSCRNLSDEPMPCGLGQHPYFPCTGATRIHADVDHVWTIDESILPAERVSAEGAYALRDRLACGQGLDNGYGGWRGAVRIGTPGVGFDVMLSSPEASFLHVYSPAGADFCALEPATHADAALSEAEEGWSSLGIKVLEPGEEMSLNVSIEVVER